MKKIILLFVLFINSFLFSQRGKDGAPTIAAGTSTIVNLYTPLSASATAGTQTVNVLSSTGYSVGDLIYIIQMQGAAVNCFTNMWGNPNSPEPYSSAFGSITGYNNAGNNEYAQIASINSNIISIDCPLKYTYLSSGKAQVVRVPRYLSLTVTGTITCPPWNGSTGGVVAIEVLGNTTINAAGRIDVSGLGFRGGFSPAVKTHAAVFGGTSWGNVSKLEGGLKGESIAGDTVLYGAMFNGKYCKGAVANGGGGGNSNNAGGGGGGNAGDTSSYKGTGNPDISVAGYVTAWNIEPGFSSTVTSSGGGRGGYTYSNYTGSPLTTPPASTLWAGDSRRVQGGMGGRPLDYNTGRLYLGGGGGAGDENDSYGASGGDGGGLINILSFGTLSGTGQILADGENGFNTRSVSTPTANDANGRDGAGGGGGGGAIFINSIGTISTITLSAKGGTGGNNQMKSGYTAFGPTAMAYGPGGGGGGGYIGTTSLSGVTTWVNGGANGIMFYISGNENCQIDNLFPPNGATKGGSGISTSTINATPTLTATPSGTICVNTTFTANASTTGTGTIGWYTATAGGTLLASGAAFTSSVISAPGTYTVYAGVCPGVYRVPTVISVLTSPTVAVTSPTICAGQSAVVTASGATNYLWNTGAPTASISVSPTTTTVYTVTGSNGTCSSSATASVIVNSGGTITVNSATICNGQSATLTAGAATSYTWSNAANSVSVSVNPTVTTTYTVNATSAGCVLTNTASVLVNTTPTVSLSSSTICSGQTTTLTASGAASYTWNTGANTASIPVTPGASTSYTVTGANGNCTNIKTATVTVNNTPTVSVNSPTICSGNSATLTANGATSYSWNTGAITNVVNPSPSVTTIYTITGTSNNCTDIKTSTVTVNTTPTVSVNSSTICSGNAATLTASGATTYSWNT
ncbi:MAG: hypothetical protein JWO32_3109 [Bacteroidetes bacterium]|nr:hypothetical protein [Bacteroidota bacterium]